MLLSIVVLSYNRPEQIKRILENMRNVENADFNLIIKDDTSPKYPEILEVVESYRDKLSFELLFYKNKTNLGYDKNLLDAFYITNSEYVFLLSDDDYINGLLIPNLLSLLELKEFPVYFTPYVSGKETHRLIEHEYDFNKFHEVIYNSILFSGLIFNREKVISLDKNEEFLSSCIYTQVFLASVIIYKTGAYGVSPEGLLLLGGDGENFFGKNQSAINSDLLEDRTKITSNLNYQAFLIRVVDEISEQCHARINTIFLYEYKKRLIAYAMRARKYGLNEYIFFLDNYKKSNLPKTITTSILLKIIVILPKNASSFIYRIGVSLLRKSG